MICDLTDFIDLPLAKPICQSTKLPLKIIYCLFIFFPLTVKIIPVWIINYIVMWLKQMSILNVCCFNSTASFLASDGDSQSSLRDSRTPRTEKYPLMSVKFLTWGMSASRDWLCTLQRSSASRATHRKRRAAVPAVQLSQVTPKEINGFLKVYFDNYVALITCP